MVTSTVDQSAPAGAVSLTDAVAVLRHRWRPVVIMLVVGVLTAFGAYKLAQPVYVAESTVRVYPLPADVTTPSVSQKDVSMATEVGVVTTPSVAAEAAKAISWTGPLSDLLEQVDVSSPSDSLLLDIQFQAGSAQGAADGADAFAKAYLAQRGAVATAAADALLKNVTAQVTKLQKQIDALDDKIDALPVNSSTRDSLVRQRDSLESQVQALGAMASSTSLLSLTPGALVGPAEIPQSKAAPRLSIYLAAGALLGLLLGLVLMAVRHRTDPKLRAFDDLEQITGLAVLGRLPNTARSRVGSVGHDTPDEYREVAVRIDANRSGSGALKVLVSSPGGHGKHVPSHLTEAAAATGLSVGLAVTDAEPVPAISAGAHLTVVRLGAENDLLPQLHQRVPLLEVREPVLDMVVIDAVNLELPSSGLALAQISSVAAIVVVEGQTRRKQLVDTVTEIGRTPAHLLGLIVVASGRRFGRWRRTRRKSSLTHPDEHATWSLTSQSYLPVRAATPSEQHAPSEGGRGPGVPSVRTGPTAKQ